MGAMYAAINFLGFQYGSTVQPVVAIERTVFYRERAAGMCSALPYAFSQVYYLDIYHLNFLYHLRNKLCFFLCSFSLRFLMSSLNPLCIASSFTQWWDSNGLLRNSSGSCFSFSSLCYTSSSMAWWLLLSLLIKTWLPLSLLCSTDFGTFSQDTSSPGQYVYSNICVIINIYIEMSPKLT